jgi:predicted transcriptional regulator
METTVALTKSRTLPPLRVSERLRADAESVLAPGESLSAFVMDAVSRSIEFRQSQQDFLSRGMASAARARPTGSYVGAHKVLAQLRTRLKRTQRAKK